MRVRCTQALTALTHRMVLRWHAIRYALPRHPTLAVWAAVGGLGLALSATRLSALEFALLLALYLIGLGLEVLNSCVEALCDMAHPGRDARVKAIKDAFGTAPAFAHSAFVMGWLLLMVAG